MYFIYNTLRNASKQVHIVVLCKIQYFVLNNKKVVTNQLAKKLICMDFRHFMFFLKLYQKFVIYKKAQQVNKNRKKMIYKHL